MAHGVGHHGCEQEIGLRPLSLTIPRKAEYLALCRLVVGALGAHEALDEESIADLKVVVTEACNCFLGDLNGGASDGAVDSAAAAAILGGGEGLQEETASLRLDFHLLPDCWEITVSDPAGRHRILPGSLCDPMSGKGLGLTIIRALVDSMEHSDDASNGSVIRLVKRIHTGDSPVA